MPTKKKKQSLTWRATKWSVKSLAKLIYLPIKGSYKLIKGSVKESSKQRKLEKSPAYSVPASLDNFSIMEVIEGDYDIAEKRIFDDSLIFLIFGKRGSGKSSLGFRLLENIHSQTKRRCYALGIEQKLMPKWISPTENIESVPNGSVILIDEGAVSFGARDSMSAKNKELSKLLAIARHKNLSLIFVTQNTGLIDKNILALADTLFVKEGSLLQMEMERPEIKKFYEKANESLKKIKGDRKSYVYLIDSDFEGSLSYSLPSFWSNNLSKNKAV